MTKEIAAAPEGFGALYEQGLLTMADVEAVEDEVQTRTKAAAAPGFDADEEAENLLAARIAEKGAPPELAAAGARRRLTEAEAAEAERAYGDAIRPDRVRLIYGFGSSLIAWAALERAGASAITLRNRIYLRRDLFGDPERDLTSYAYGFNALVHELSHVRQYDRLGFLGVVIRIARDAIRYGADGAYRYESRDQAFADQPLEGQSQIHGDYGTLHVFGPQGLRDAQVFNSEETVRRYAAGCGIYGQ